MFKLQYRIFLLISYEESTSYEIKSPSGGMRTAACKVNVAMQPPQVRVSQAKLFFAMVWT